VDPDPDTEDTPDQAETDPGPAESAPRPEESATPAESAPPEESATPADELRRRYRQLLDRKSAEQGRGGGDGAAGRGLGPYSNDRRQRTFRRKAGG
jgi:hypothetical protein